MNTRLFDLFDNHRFLKFNSPWWNEWEVIYNSPETNYPPYDVEKDGDNFVLTFAVAGFKKHELEITHIKREKKLEIAGEVDVNSGQKCKCNCQPCECSIKKGIAKRPFTISFTMNDAKVASTKLEDGILTIVVEPVEPPKDEVETIEIQ